MTCCTYLNGLTNDSSADTAFHQPMEDKDLRQAFMLFDVNRDGRITEAELSSVLGFLGINASQTEVQRMITEADSNGNGTVEFEEFLKMMRRYSQEKTRKARDEARREMEMMDAFRVFDHNNDSVIDFDEIKRTMHFLGEAVTDDEVRDMIRVADQDHDGRVNFEEFKIMMQKMNSRKKSMRRQNRSSSRNPARAASLNKSPGPCNGKM